MSFFARCSSSIRRHHFQDHLRVRVTGARMLRGCSPSPEVATVRRRSRVPLELVVNRRAARKPAFRSIVSPQAPGWPLAPCGALAFFLLIRINPPERNPTMTADKDYDCVSYACECARLAALTDDEELRRHLLKLARQWLAMREREYSDTRVTARSEAA
jgi:hypothetical protein